MSELSVEIRVTSVRNPGKFGGAIFAGVTSTKDYFVAVCSNKVIPDASIVSKGQRWAITGTLENWQDQNQIRATSAEMLRPSGRNIIEWIAKSPDCAKIGPVKAGKLFERFGPQLIEHIQAKNLDALTEVINAEAAELLCHAFEKHNVANALLWLDRIAVDRCMGMKIVNFYGDEAQSKIEENPYCLISFAESWKKVDILARNRFGISPDDPRRLDAAVEETLYSGMRDGHTCLPIKSATKRLRNLLPSQELAEKALALEMPSPQYRRVDDTLQGSGIYLIERYVAERLTQITKGEVDGQKSLLGMSDTDSNAVERAIAKYETMKGFTLSAEQRAAVKASASANLSLILGGAGTGKTTVLEALYMVLEATHSNISIYQIALAGRAAQRMTEATNRDSKTIAGFLNQVGPELLGHGSVVVVDEMSMVDVILMYRLLRHIPPGTRLILVGDPSQLPPIGPGLVLHALAGHPAIAQTELKVTKRQSAESGIPAVAAAIREHRIPAFADYKCGAGVSFVRCADADIKARIMGIYGELGGNGADYSVQVLSMTKGGYGGLQSINTAFHDEFRQEAASFYTYDSVHGKVRAQALERIPLRVGDLVMYTENNYELGLRNGSLGKIIEGFEVEDINAICCVCVFDCIRYELNSNQANALTHAYSITVHKSQGSQFSRVIVPIRKSRLLDQALIYTAVTRGIEQVVLVGDWNAACAAIEAPATAAMRHISLPSLLEFLATGGH